MRKTALQIFWAFGLSLAVLYTLLIRYTSFLMYSRIEKYQISGFLFIIVAPLLAYLLVLLIKKITRLAYPSATIVKYLIFSTMLSSLFLLFFYSHPPVPMVFHLIIKPVVDGSAQPFDKKINITSVSVINKPSNKEMLLINPVKVAQVWDFNSNSASFSYQGNGPGAIEYREYIQGDLRITFEESPKAGSVRVSLNDEEQTIDLYAAEPGVYTLNLAVPYNFRQADWIRRAVVIGLLAAELLVFSFVCFLIILLADQIYIRKTIQVRGCGAVVLVIAVSLSMVFWINWLEKEVVFGDENLETAMREVLGNPDKPIYYQQLQTVAYLDITGKEIHSLDGIENLKNLIELKADYNYISDLTPLGSLRNLKTLSLAGNSLTDLKGANIEAISNLPIRSLNLSDNGTYSSKFFRIKLSDITLLGEFSLLEELSLQNNVITDISPLAGLSKLRVLNLRDNQISALPNLCELKSLKELNLRSNRLVDIRALGCLSTLKELNLHSNPSIASIEPLKNLTNLSILILENNDIGDQIDAIEHLTKLSYLNLSNCGLSDISALGVLMSKGALQDNPEQQVYATVMLRDNPLLLQNAKALEIINKYWENITYRDPAIAPQIWLKVQPPRFSKEGGLYRDGFALELFSDNQNQEILYTLDGSEPNIANLKPTNSLRKTLVYSDPISIKSRNGDANIFSMIVTANEAQEWIPQWYPPRNEVFKATVIRARTYDPESDSYSKTVTNTYFVDKNIHKKYETLPIISITADYRDLFDPNFGIYMPAIPTNDYIEPYQYNERRVPANIEFFEIGGTPGFNGLYEISLQGVTSRSSPQKGLNVLVNEWFGEEIINYPIFKDADSKANQLTQFKRFIIRSWGSSRDWPMIFSDAYHQTLLAKADLDIQDYRPAIVFINGEYWGLHEVRQAIKNPDYFSSYTGIDPENPGFDILEERDSIADEGDSDSWQALEDFIQNNDLVIEENYQYVKDHIEIENFITYVIHCTFTGKRDWPGHNESKWRPRTIDGKWRWLQYDMDHGLNTHGRPQYDMFAHILDEGPYPYPVFIALLKNRSFKEQFINTYADYLNSYFLTSVELDHFYTILDEIEPYLSEYQDRWQLNLGWESDKAYAIESITSRHDIRLLQLKRNYNLGNTSRITLETNPTQGQIQINSIVINDDLPGVVTADSWSGVYFEGVPVTITAIPQTGYQFDHWESNIEIDLDYQSDVIVIDPKTNITLTAIFSRTD